MQGGLETVSEPRRGFEARSILVVEHDAPQACNIRSSLVRFGYTVPAIATSASEALAAIEDSHPDLIVIDVSLAHGNDGISVAAEIRARHPTPIVFLAAHSDDATLMRARDEAEPYGYLLTPYKDRELRATVEVALKRFALDQEARKQSNLLSGVLDGISDAVAATDADGNVILLNHAARAAFGKDLLNAVSASPPEPHAVYLPDQKTIFPQQDLPLVRALGGDRVYDAELFVRSTGHPEGRWFSVNAGPLLDAQGSVCGAVEVGRDVTEVHAARSELQQQSETDVLTGVFNRRGFMDLASRALEVARSSGRHSAVFFVDIDDMKRTNDTLGHGEGDRLLMDVTWILRACFRTSDVIGRLGGDEFVVFAPDAGDHAALLRERVQSSVEEFNSRSDRAYRVSVSIGVSTGDPSQHVGLDELVAEADQRMYEAKLARSPTQAAAAPAPREAALLPKGLPAPRALILPPAKRPSTIPPSDGLDARAATKRVLLVDDEPRNLYVLERLLAPLGHECLRAEDGQSAIAMFDACRPDLVLLDLVLPGVDGFDVLRHIRTVAADDYVPVIVLTGHSEREHKRRGLEAGADDFLEKPPDGRSLRARITTLLQLKESRDALRRANADLASRNAALSRLQRQQRELTTFLVHDLKSPLSGLWADLEFARDQVDDATEDTKDALEEAALSCLRLRSMLDDLLIVSRLEESALPLHKEVVAVQDLLCETVGRYARRAAHRRVTLLEPAQSELTVRADRTLLQRVIENILDNSLRYTPQQGTLGVEVRDRDAVEITVSNTGPPIPPAARARIFDKFARLGGGAQSGNAGLGLYFCKLVVEALGGTIEVTETPEWPTSFVLRLPAAC